MFESFKIAAISDNSNSFGLHQFIAINNQGKAFKACKSKQFIPALGDKINVPVNEQGSYEFSHVGELAQKMPDAPLYIIQELWPEIF